MLDHQSLKDLELLNLPKIDIFVKILSILRGFSILVLWKLDGRAPNPCIWLVGVHVDPWIPMGTLGEVE